MSTFGCHNCGVKLKDWEGKPYESWPCATCALAKNYYHTFSTGYFDTSKMEEVEDEHAGLDQYNDVEFVTSGKTPLTSDEITTLKTMQRAITRQVMAMFSGCIVGLLKMGKENPQVLEALIKKMQFPYMSYSEIGESMEPKCSKQNVLYYLKTAVSAFPDLEALIQTDTRYSNGHFALRTLADRRRQQVAEERLQKILYRDKYATMRFGMDELNKILRLPFNIDSDVFDFNAYLEDDNHVQGTSEDED